MTIEFSTVLFCDDIRKEASGKDIVIGVYGGPVNVHAYPTPFALSLFIEIVPTEAGQFPINLRISSPSGNPPVTIDANTLIQKVEPATVSIVGIPLQLERDGLITVEAAVGGGGFRKIKEKLVKRVPSGTTHSPTLFS
jgi:hypothetical protein